MSKQNKMITGLEKHIIYNSNHFTFMKVKFAIQTSKEAYSNDML